MADNLKRKCVKCGSSPHADDPNIKLHRFPKPGSTNMRRCELWAKYCFPDKLWSSVDFQGKLYSEHRMLCNRHFKDSEFINIEEKKLSKHAVPDMIDFDEVIEAQNMENLCDNNIQFSKNQDVSELHSIIESVPGRSQILMDITNQKVSFTARGLMPPVFTPLNDDLTINYGVIPTYAKFLADSGIKSVLVGGTTGEHMTLSVSDRKKVVDSWMTAAKTTGLHIQVQVGGAPFADVVNLASYCQEIGVNSLLTLPELYFKPESVEDLVFYVAQVAKAAPKLPVLYYHIPHMTKVQISMPAFVAAATASIPNFKGIKFTSNDLSEGAQVLRTLKDGQEIFLGADSLLAPAALLGIKSSIGTSFNLFPRLAQDILDAVENNDVRKARVLQEKLSLAIEAHTCEGPWVPIMKAGMEIVSGIKVGPPSLPQRPLTAEAKQRIQSRLRTLGLCK